MEQPERAAEAAAQGRPSRTNLLLSATIQSGAVSGPVRIRNLSENGALLEGATLPPVGSRLTLRRLELEIGATVIWTDRGRCGVRFDGTISVTGWRQGNWIAPAGRSKLANQKIGQSGPGLSGGEEISYAEEDALVADELGLLRQLLENLGAQLVEPANEAQRIIALQQFDIASQTLGHLADVLRAEDRGRAIEGIGLESLRRRLLAARSGRAD